MLLPTRFVPASRSVRALRGSGKISVRWASFAALADSSA